MASGTTIANIAPLFSIIIPVYNVERYIHKCLSSVAAQTIDEIEVIVVDDGSTDGSFAICEAFCIDRKNFKLLRKTNEGQGAARNFGLSIATGKYVLFVDSDDWIEPTLCEQALGWFKKNEVDFVNFGIDFIGLDGKVVRSMATFKQEVLLGFEIFRHAMVDDQIYSSPCNKVYKRAFLEMHNIRFPAVRASEDTHFSRFLSLHATRTLFVSTVFYHALVRPGSTTRNMTSNYVSITLGILEKECNIFKEKIDNKEIEALCGAHMSKLLSYLLVQAAFRTKAYSDYIRCFEIVNYSKYSVHSRNKRCLAYLSIKTRIIILLARFPRAMRFSAKLSTLLGKMPY